jgi:alanine racemase
LNLLDRREFLAAIGLGAVSGTVGAGLQMHSQSEQHSATGFDPWIELDRSALRHNLHAIGERTGGRPIMAVIKANGYGHGLLQMGEMLQREGIDRLAVAKVAEAVALREAGIEGMLLNFGPFSHDNMPEIIGMGISQTVFSDQVEELAAEARRRNGIATVQVNIDTGLGRVGVPCREAVSFLKRVAGLEGIRLEGVFTALTEDPEFDRVQLQRFLDVCQQARNAGIDPGVRHAASSAGLITLPEAFLDMVRPGIAIYGHYPSAETWQDRPIDLRPVLSLKSGVVLVKTLEPGDSLSYHRAFVADRPTRIATLPLGYSDGYPHTLANNADVLIRGRRFPVVALITANHVLVNLGEDGEIVVGDEVVLVGRQGDQMLDAQVLADRAGTSVYKLLIGLNAHLPRRISE